eukprot:13865654-Alexandrium_andersonii.AAC.1
MCSSVVTIMIIIVVTSIRSHLWQLFVLRAQRVKEGRRFSLEAAGLGLHLCLETSSPWGSLSGLFTS